MATFKPRLTSPSYDNTYFFGSGNPYNANKNTTMPNCTAYAYGRFWEIKGGSAPSNLRGDAGTWWITNASHPCGQIPKLGAIMCWKKLDGYGHVAIVEEIQPNGDVIYSESWYQKKFFGTNKSTKSSGYAFQSGYIFQGFIYCGIEFDKTTGSGITNSNPSILNPATRNITKTAESELIWKYLIYHINNPYGVAGLMGNLQAESGLIACRLQGDFGYSSGYQTSVSYTNNIDNKSIGKETFATSGPNGGGYGLAQWTDPGRKRKMYDYCTKRGSIGNIISQLEFLLQEMKSGYADTYNTLLNANSVFEASTKVLTKFEIPVGAYTAEKQNERASIGQTYYNKYKNITKETVAKEEANRGINQVQDDKEEEKEEEIKYEIIVRVLAIGEVED